MTAQTEIERKALGALESVKQTADENSRVLLIGGALLLTANWVGWINLGLPGWWPLAAGIVVSAGAAAYVGADKVAELIPEEDGIWLIAFHTADGKGGEIWEIHEDDWKDMTVDGTLFEWSESPIRVYECRAYDPDENHAVANWRESKPASEIAAEASVEDALAAIRELRQDLEPEAAKAREMRRRIRGITRQLDRQRAQELNSAIDEATVDADMTDATITKILDDALPEDLHPHAGGGDGPDEMTNGHAEREQRIEIEQQEFDAILDEETPTPRGL